MSMIAVSHLTFRYDGGLEDVFSNASFSFDTDWKLGFVGRNGRGKTTFLQLLLGSYPYTGSIVSSVPFRYFPMSVTDPSLPAMEVVSLLSGCGEAWRIRREWGRLLGEPDALARPYASLSGGERTKAQLIALFLSEDAFPLIDEPTNHLDMAGRRALGKYLSGKKGFLLVSHDRALLDACTDHTLSINRQSIQVVNGSFSSWERDKALRDAYEQAENARLLSEINRLKSAARQSRQWADRVESQKIGRSGPKQEISIDSRAYIGEKSRRMQQRRKNLEKRQQAAISEKSELLKDVERADELLIKPLPAPARRLISLTEAAACYDDHPSGPPASFTLHAGERLALTGRNGSGKTSLIKLCLNENLPRLGDVVRQKGLIISYVPQSASFLSGLPMDYARARGVDPTLFFTILRKLDFPREAFERDMASFSAGQKKKVLLAESLASRAHLYIWDEPLNYVDVLSRMQIEEMILSGKPTMLLIEHDQTFLTRVATRTLALSD